MRATRLGHEACAESAAVELAGRLSLGALAAVHRCARLLITTDRGTLRLARLGSLDVGMLELADAAA
ncbi:MAG: hypothetical protein M3327_15765 [Actinomycetota bacterium]|nr:hypothetical protein [Actinomycetota bacterium]